MRHELRKGLCIAGLVIVVLLAWTTPIQADGAPPPQATPFTLRDVGFDPHLNAQVPPDLTFRDDTGQTVRLQDYFGTRPLVLTLNDLTCQDLCPLALNSLVDVMVQIPFRLGADYQVVTVGLNPNNTTQDAADMKAAVTHRYARPDTPGAAAAWHFLTGTDANIKQLAQAVGFRYAYDTAQNEYAHPVGVMLLTPDGRVARYLYGMDLPSNDLRLGLVEASQRVISTPVDALLLLCYHYDPAAGRYSGLALNAVRAGGVLTVLSLGLFMGVMWRRDIKGRKGPGGTGGEPTKPPSDGASL